MKFLIPIVSATALALALVVPGKFLTNHAPSNSRVPTSNTELSSVLVVTKSCATDGVDTLVKNFWNASQNQFFKGFNAGTCDINADYWLAAEALHATIDSYGLTHRADLLEVFESYYNFHQSKGKGWLEAMPSGYYDDEEWMALAMVRAAEVTHDPKYILPAITIEEDVERGWDSTCCGATKGGIWWNGRHSQKSTVSNAVAVVIAARIGMLTKDPKYIQFAEKVYDYWFEQMVIVAPFNHQDFLQVGDHILPNGTKVGGLLTYNEGMMVGAAVALYNATGRPQYLDQAKKFYHYMIDQETTPTPFGKVLTDHALSDIPNCKKLQMLGDWAGLPQHQDFPLFKYTAFRSLNELLLALHPNDPDRVALQKFLIGNIQAACQIAKDPASGLFSVNWEKREPKSIQASLISPIAAAVGSMALFAQPPTQ